VPITLNRGGELKLCATTSVHLARDRSIQAADGSGLMLGLDRGAIEAHYETSKYSDVLMTPDLRILISRAGRGRSRYPGEPPGRHLHRQSRSKRADITVTSQMEGGLYRVQPGQHVSFLHGSLREVVDTEHEPCGCPAPISVADAGTSAPVGRRRVSVGGPSSTPADTAFRLAVSEGLSKPPMPSTTPVAAPGEVHAQVAVPFRYDGNLPSVSDATGTGGAADADVARYTASIAFCARSVTLHMPESPPPAAASGVHPGACCAAGTDGRRTRPRAGTGAKASDAQHLPPR